MSGERSSHAWLPRTSRGVAAYIFAAGCVMVGVSIGLRFEGDRRSASRVRGSPHRVLDCVTQWDAQWYLTILNHGYDYDPKERSSVAYFPAYPLLGRALAHVTAWSGHSAAWAVAQACLVASFGVFSWYLADRPRFLVTDVSGRTEDFESKRSRQFAIAALALYPPSFFMWMAYSESVFLLLCLAAMLGIKRAWHPLWVALLAGAVTATRPVGIALLVPLAIYVWRRNQTANSGLQIADWPRYARISGMLVLLLPIGCWGLLAYMAYQWHEFGTPVAFAQTQENWSMRSPIDLGKKVLILGSGEPIWSAYVPGSAAHWTNLEPDVHPLLSLHFLEPLYFVAALVLVYIGALRQWLNGYEVLLAAGLLFIPYVTKGYEQTMASQARYTTVVFPIYIVLGQMMGRAPWWVAVGVLTVCATFFIIYTAMWSTGHVVI